MHMGNVVTIASYPITELMVMRRGGQSGIGYENSSAHILTLQLILSLYIHVISHLSEAVNISEEQVGYKISLAAKAGS